MATGQVTLFITSAAVGGAGGSTPVRGSLPDGSIDVQQFNLVTTNQTTIGSATSGAGAGKVQFTPLEIVVAAGPELATLFQANASGSHFNTATLYVRDGAARVTELLEFKLVFVTSIALAGSSGDGTVLEDVQFAYGALRVTTMNPATSKVVTQASWSQVTNTPTFDVPGVTAASLPKATASQAPVANAQSVTAKALASAAPSTIKLAVAKPQHGTTLLTARVASPQGVPTGNVTFYSGKTRLGQAAVGPDGRATLSVPTASIGKTKPFAIYSGGPDSAFRAATTVTGEAALQKNFQKWLGRPMTQDEWVLTSMWLQEGFTPSKMAGIYKTLATKSS